MLSKFETKSNRVKGLSFHPKRPWILASLHNGVIQLWDYRISALIDKFDEHDGPVRGICFHPTQPLFVSGGDDNRIKVWNYKLKRCLFTLTGHLDYIRTVQFHHESPWILSASDDQTIRIWNWQSRSCISILTGHNHYVMCAQFHPKEMLVVSASLDQTVRVWDVTGLRTKNYSPSNEDSLKFGQNDLFGNSDVIVTHVLEGHERGVNWAAFNKNVPLIVSGADDRLVKFWRMSETKAWEVDTLRGHYNNVSCVLFHPRQDLILSNSEDNTIRVWDTTKRNTLGTFRREHDRFWILASHPEHNLFAAGHDTGLLVFKLEHERPAYSIFGGKIVYYIKERYLRTYNIMTGKERATTIAIRKSNVPLSGKPRIMHYNQAENAILVLSNEKEKSWYDLYYLGKGKSGNGESKRGQGIAVAWVARNRFVVLDKFKKLLLKNMENNTKKTIYLPPEVMTTDNIFPAGTGSVLLREVDKVSLFDLQQKRVLNSVKANFIKFAIWSNKGKDGSQQLALIGRDVIIITNKKLEPKCRIYDKRVKSGAWHDNGVFIYTTLNHIKYCLPNGDTGIIRTLDVPIYITAVKKDKVFFLDRKCKNRVINIDVTEFVFKLALVQNNYQLVLKMVNEADLIGQSIIKYLQKKGYPQVALHFIKDDKTRFNLAIECGNIDEALESAKAVNIKEYWHTLAFEALKQGNHQVVEMAYQRTNNYESLSFLYLITGNFEKLSKMLKIANKRNDIMSCFHNSLYLGNVEERVNVLMKANQFSLAYATAVTYNLQDKIELLETKLEELKIPTQHILKALNNVPEQHALLPPTPINLLAETNWPLLAVSKGIMETMLANKNNNSAVVGLLSDDGEDDIDENQWGDSLNIPDDINGFSNNNNEDDLGGDDNDSDLDVGGAWDDIDIDLSGVDISLPDKSDSKDSFFRAPKAGPSISDFWSRNSELAVDMIAAGNLETAMNILNQEAGIVNFAPLKPFFSSIYLSSYVSVPSFASLPSLISGIDRNWQESSPKSSLPVISTDLSSLVVKLKSASTFTTEGKFPQALKLFLNVAHSVIFVNPDDHQEAQELLTLCRHYITGLKLEIARREEKDLTRQCELSTYFTHCKLQPKHLILSLNLSMGLAYKIQNFQLAGSLAKRLLELNPKSNLATKARKIIAISEQKPSNKIKINYDERNPFVICCGSFTPIYKGTRLIKCSYCGSAYLPNYKGSLCKICGIAEVGKDVKGFFITKKRRRGY